MNIRFINIISIFLLLFAGVSRVTAQDDDVRIIEGDIIVIDEENPNVALNYDYSGYVKIYTFLTKGYAEEALVALKNGDKVITAENIYRPDSDGHFRIENVPSTGFILVWCSDYDYKAQNEIIPHIHFSRKMSIDLVRNSLGGTEYEDKGDVERRTTASGITLYQSKDSAVVTASIKRGETKPRTDNIEGPDGMICTFRHRIPYKVYGNMRVLVQPILYDRADISSQEADTVYSYGHAVYHNMDEYELTQLHRMDFDLSHDSINYYIGLQGDIVFYNGIMRDTLKSDEEKPHVWLNATHDTIDVFVTDRFRGYDPDTSHPYPYGICLTIDDYNTEICSFYFKNNGERRNALRFLNFSFQEFLPNRELFFEDLEAVSIDHPGELKLNFGKAGNFTLAANDTASHAALRDLEQELYQAQHSDEKEHLHSVSVYGIASPEGNLQSNRNLARKRADFAVGKIRSYIPSRIPIAVKTDVAGWNILADSLKRGGHDAVADAIYDIVNRFPINGKDDVAGFRRQQNEITKLPEYRELILKEYLPKLRTVTYNYVIKREGKLPTDTIISRYRKNPKKRFNRGEYWELFDKLDDKRELMEVARYALQVTRDTLTADSVYSKGYWPYAAAVLACSYIACDTVDLELLRPFFNLELDSLGNVERPDSKRSRYDNKRIVKYTNFPDMAANQLIMILRSKGAYSQSDIAALEGIIEAAANDAENSNSSAYEKLLAFSLCLRGQYNRTEERYVKARDLVANSSPQNFVVMALAMDDPSTSDDDAKWLIKAKERIASIEKNDIINYMSAVLELRLESAQTASRNFDNVTELLAGCFVNDIKYLLIASNDADLLVKQGKEESVFPRALNKWIVQMDNMNLGENHPYYWFMNAWKEAKAKSPNVETIEQQFHKCFSIDERYVTVLNMFMRDKSKELDKRMLKLLRSIRDSYLNKK